MNDTLKTGDGVELKFGGGDVEMTIVELTSWNGEPWAICKFYSEKEGKFLKDGFALSALKKIKEN